MIDIDLFRSRIGCFLPFRKFKFSDHKRTKSERFEWNYGIKYKLFCFILVIFVVNFKSFTFLEEYTPLERKLHEKAIQHKINAEASKSKIVYHYFKLEIISGL